ncbi:MAG: DUF4392 domain-containing protein, partial [Acidobacteria bacterium]
MPPATCSSRTAATRSTRCSDMSIENIVLSRDHRGVSALRPYLAPDFCERAASVVLEHPGTALVVTGFFIPGAGATETDGPPGAIAVGQAL